MRILPFIVMTLLVGSAHAQAPKNAQAPNNAQAQNNAQTQQTSPEGLACFENLSAPEFPKAALQAHVDGSVWMTTHVSPQGTVDKVDTEVVSAWGDGPKLLTPPAEKALRAAKVNPACAGKSVSVVFRYQLHGDPTANPKVTSKTEPPNIMWIESEPAAASRGEGSASLKK
jgi:outer membrane biosynthesis protein TonB